ncbi:diguanylate cyclase/phosphodiesterase with PAS/PAC sensor(s) [Paraburkholderia sp. BL6665CI2N2]|nr:diguanylate cyclase/phosphodiesterase with PAS/PAC sensor(s) [Paraburkholderia sp. BL6665CI2N2]
MALYETTPAILHSINSEFRLIHVSDLWLKTFGYGREEIVGQVWTGMLTDQSRKYAEETALPELFRLGYMEGVEYEVMRKDGNILNVVVSSVMTYDAAGVPLLSITAITDITANKRLRAALENQHEHLRITLDSISDGVITVCKGGKITYLNAAAEQLTGWKAADAQGQRCENVISVSDQITNRSSKSLINNWLTGGDGFAASKEVILASRDGKSEYHVEVSSAEIRSIAGNEVGIVIVFRNVSEQHHLQKELLFRATHDELTGILNRGEFDRRLHRTLQAMSNRDETSSAVLYMDLDGFKVVNDAAGHATGDRLLKQVVGILSRIVRKTDTLARLGGDEFGVVFEHCSMSVVRGIAQKICDQIDALRFQHEGQRLHISASIGLVQIDEYWQSAASVLGAADSACYVAKESGRNRVHTYSVDDRMIKGRLSDMNWVRKIEAALDHERFVLYWQEIKPLSEPDSGYIHGEILLRLIGDENELILPSAFLAAAERFRIVSRIDRWVVRKVFRWMAEHHDEIRHVQTMAINLSGLSINDGDFHAYVYELLDAIDFDHRKICFEITETSAIQHLEESVSFIESLNKYGVRFSLDDFGSGASSFGYLKELPVDFLKIDGQFIRGLTEDPIGQATVRCINEVARITGKRTIAEFVETEAVEKLLKQMGVNYTQGYLRHRPAELDLILRPFSPAGETARSTH